MTQTKALLVIGCLSAAVVVAAQHLSPAASAAKEPPWAAQKWAYATLFYDEPIGPDYGSIATWTTGKKILGARWEKDKAHPFSKLNKDLGGKEPEASIGVLLDRIGQEGWELVSHSRTEGVRRITQTWTFKLPAR
jgi:hypothetical protein